MVVGGGEFTGQHVGADQGQAGSQAGNYIRGTAVNVELETEAEALSGLNNEEWMDAQEPALQAILATGEFPRFQRLATAGYDFDLDSLFEFGLQRLLDGIATLLEEEH